MTLYHFRLSLESIDSTRQPSIPGCRPVVCHINLEHLVLPFYHSALFTDRIMILKYYVKIYDSRQ